MIEPFEKIYTHYINLPKEEINILYTAIRIWGWHVEAKILKMYQLRNQ